MAKRILIVDDDSKLIGLLSEYLGNNQFVVFHKTDGLEALDAVDQTKPDIVILDYMLPGKDGLEVLREIRSRHDMPVIMLTARGDDTDKIVGLELGADDYLAKPFNPRELLARIKAVLRRARASAPDTSPNDAAILKTGALRLNRLSRTVELDGKPVRLSVTEFKILEVLMKHPNRILSRDQIMTMAQGRDFMAFDRSIDVHISKIRLKIEKDPLTPKRIQTVWGSGYLFADPA